MLYIVFPGENDIDQLGIVIRALGTPNEDIWPGVKGKHIISSVLIIRVLMCTSQQLGSGFLPRCSLITNSIGNILLN